MRLVEHKGIGKSFKSHQETWRHIEFEGAEFNYDDTVRVKTGAADYMQKMGFKKMTEYEGLIGKIKSHASSRKTYHVDFGDKTLFMFEACLEKYDEQREQMNELENTL